MLSSWFRKFFYRYSRTVAAVIKCLNYWYNVLIGCFNLVIHWDWGAYWKSISLFQTTIKVYARCLRPDIEYKTLSITFQTTCKEVVGTLLGKYKMKHRDPKLFYLSMEVTVRKAGVRTHLTLDDEARPAVLQSCHPKGDSK